MKLQKNISQLVIGGVKFSVQSDFQSLTSFSVMKIAVHLCICSTDIFWSLIYGA